MKVTLIMACSVDGKSTKWNQNTINDWTSKEDFDHFCKVRKEHTALIMGRKTYDVVKPNPEKERVRIVVTKNPKSYKHLEVPEQLEFTNESPLKLCNRLKKQGHKKILLLGGSSLNSSFLKQKLITDILLTIEPKIFGSGKMFLDEEKLNIQLQLISAKKLNKKGSLLLHYETTP